MTTDWSHLVSEIFLDHHQTRPTKVKRFTTGLSLFVFDVWLENGERRVIRIAHESRIPELEAGIRWHRELAQLSCPLPTLYATGERKGYGFAIYERLPGSDLEEVYDNLSETQIRGIAEEVAAAQSIIGQLNADLFEGPHSWESFLQGVLGRSKRGFHANRLFAPSYLDEVEAIIHEASPYFSSITPTPFLYDLNVRNVIIHHGKMSGIVDVDDVSIGDPLLAIGRGKTLLLWANRRLDLVTHWIDYLQLDSQQQHAINIYALLYCIRSMSVLGTTLNGNPNIQTDVSKASDLIKVTDQLLTDMKHDRSVHS